MKLYHFTCDHGIHGISQDGSVRPNTQPLLRTAPPIIWLTDLDVPDRSALGLTSMMLECDRTRHRLDVDAEHVRGLLHWPAAAREWKIPRPVRDLLENSGALPMHWYVTAAPIDVQLMTLAPLQPR